jgi:hypothetical protein
MNKFSNILKIPPFTDLYKEMVNKIAQKLKTADPSSDAPMFAPSERKFDDLMMVDTPSHFGISAQYDESKYRVKSINEISDSDEKFVLHVNVMQIFPQPVYEYVSVICQKCQMR